MCYNMSIMNLNENQKLYIAAMGLVNLASHIKTFDAEYAQELLNKAEEYKNKIIIDENFEKEIDEYVKEIERRL